MKKLLLALLLLFSVQAYAAGTATVTSDTISSRGSNPLVVVTITWVDDTNGTTQALSANVMSQIYGKYLYQAITDPDADIAPTDDYDIVINDADGFDIAGAALNDRDEANTEVAFPPTATRPIDSTLTFALSGNSVNNAAGVLKLYFTTYPNNGTLTVTGSGDASADKQDDQTALLTTMDADTSTIVGLILATGADAVPNTNDMLQVAAFNYCFNGTSWDRCFTYNPCDRASRTTVAINESASAQIVAASASKKIYVCSGMLATDADETVKFVEGTGTVCATNQNALSGIISLPADGNGFIINYIQTNTASDAFCIIQGGTEDIDGWITYVQE